VRKKQRNRGEEEAEESRRGISRGWGKATVRAQASLGLPFAVTWIRRSSFPCGQSGCRNSVARITLRNLLEGHIQRVEFDARVRSDGGRSTLGFGEMLRGFELVNRVIRV
jgi:hypothetical protein